MQTHKLLVCSTTGPLAHHSSSRDLIHNIWESPNPPTPTLSNYWNYWIYFEGTNCRVGSNGYADDSDGHRSNIPAIGIHVNFNDRGIKGNGTQWADLRIVVEERWPFDFTSPPLLKIKDDTYSWSGGGPGTIDIEVPWNQFGYISRTNGDLLMQLRYTSILQWVSAS